MAQLTFITHSLVTQDASVAPKEWPLNDEGRAACKQLASALRPLKLNLLISSVEPKAAETAELLAAALHINWQTAPGLDEHRRPYAEPREFERLMGLFFGEPSQRVFGDESAEEARSRFAAAVDSVVGSNPGASLGIVSHGTVIALYAAPMFGIGAGALWERLRHPAFLVIDYETSTGQRIVDELD